MDIEEQYDKIYRFCYYKVHNREIAEDITQETFLRFLYGGYEEQGKALNYLYSVARNLCIDEMRRPHWDSIDDKDILDDGGFEDNLIGQIHLRRALGELSEEEREILFLRYVNGEPMSVISAMTGLSRFALHRRISGIKKKLRVLLEMGQSDHEEDK